MHGNGGSRHLDRLIADLGERRHAVVGHQQLLDLCVGRGAIEHRIRTGHLHRLFPGAYAIGTPLVSEKGKLLAATIAFGALASHRSAAWLWAIRRHRDAVELTVPSKRRPRKGIVFHTATIPEDEITTHDSIPITTVPRTILDLAGVLPRPQVETAIHEVEVQELWDRLSLPDLLERYPRRRGTAVIRDILRDQTLGEGRTRSELEDAFAAFAAEVALPPYEANAMIQAHGIWWECDAVWRKQRLIVELDGKKPHLTRRKFESDRTKDRALTTAGWKVIRITWRELHRNRAALATDLLQMLPTPRAPLPSPAPQATH